MIRSSMLHRIWPAFVLLAGVSTAQTKPAPPATWMDLAVGTDVSYTIGDDNKAKDAAGGTGSGGAGKRAARIVVLGAGENGGLRVAVFDEQLPTESYSTAIVRAEIAVLDPATGALQREPEAVASPAARFWSPGHVFPFPPLTAAE